MNWFKNKHKHIIGEIRNETVVGDFGVFPRAFRAETTCPECKIIYEIREECGPIARKWLIDRIGPLATKKLNEVTE